MLKKYRHLIIRISLILIAIVLVLIYMYCSPVHSVTNLIFTSFIIAYAIKPIKDYISEKFKISERKSSLIIILFCILSFIVLLYFLIPAIIKESSNVGPMLDSIELYAKNLIDKFNINKIPMFETAYLQISERINIFFSSITSNLGDSVITVMENLIGLAIVPIIAYYFLADGEIIYNKLMLIFPTDKRIIIKRINKNIDKVLGRYIISQLILSLIIGILTFGLLLVLGIRFNIVLSLINAVTNIIPYFGPILGGVPIVFIALTMSPTKGLLALIGVLLIQQVEGNILAPTITGDSTNMHPIIIIILLILGEKIGGMIGMVVIIPIAVIVKVIYDDINYYLF